MKILHCCLAAFYIDNYNYQENVIPRMHFKQGHNVMIVASTETYINKTQKGHTSKGSYFNSDGILVNRLPYFRFLPIKIVEKLRLYTGLKKCLNEFQPDIIFLHDALFLSILTIVGYVKNNNVVVYVDCHTDFINSGKNWLSKNLLHKIIYRFCIQKISPYTKKFYGTLPLRCSFLNEVYKVPISKIELLPFGVDDSAIKNLEKDKIKLEIRKLHNIDPCDFVMITGGKLDSRKNIDKLLNAFSLFEDKCFSNSKKIWIFIFGKPSIDIEVKFKELILSDKIVYLEWLESMDIYKYFMSADLAVFPGTHSVLWEEAAGLGIPLVLKRWKGIEHLDLGGNCCFLEEATVEEIFEVVFDIYNNQEKFKLMKSSAQEKGPINFSYSDIALRSIK